jgi:hypothetical protein
VIGGAGGSFTGEADLWLDDWDVEEGEWLVAGMVVGV